MADGAARALVGNAADPQQVERGRKREKRRADREYELDVAQLATYDGREYVWLDLDAFGIFDTLDGPMELVFAKNELANEGRRRMAKWMQRHPEGFLLMQREALARAGRDSLETEAAQASRERTE